MNSATSGYCIRRTLSIPTEAALERVREGLARQGFGILSEIDVAATFKKKLNHVFKPYTILGACNPPLALRALSVEQDIGVFLPCNVVVYAADEPGSTVVAAVDPVVSLGRVGRPDLEPVALEVKARLEQVLADL